MSTSLLMILATVGPHVGSGQSRVDALSGADRSLHAADQTDRHAQVVQPVQFRSFGGAPFPTPFFSEPTYPHYEIRTPGYHAPGYIRWEYGYRRPYPYVQGRDPRRARPYPQYNRPYYRRGANFRRWY